MNKTPPAHHSKTVEHFLQNTSKHLQFLREYSALLQDPYPMPEDVGRLFLSAQTLRDSSASCGYPLFSEIAGKLAHILEYTGDGTVGLDAFDPIVDFISEAVAVLESDLLMISANGLEAVEDLKLFRAKYPFAFKQAGTAAGSASTLSDLTKGAEETISGHAPEAVPHLPTDGEIPQEILEFFIPEAEEHLQIVTECLLSLEANPHANEDIHRLFRAIHTVKGAAAQVGLHRIARVAHRTEDLVGRLRDGLLMPSAAIVGICLESVDVLKKILYKQWPDEGTLQQSVQSLLIRITQWAPEEAEGAPSVSSSQAAPRPAEESGVVSAKVVQNQPVPVPQRIVEMVKPAAGKEEVRILPAEHHTEPRALPQSKSVRVSLDLLDQMLNVVGELVTKRTRMRGRLTELEQLANMLNFSRERISEKLTEFQHKYELGNLTLPRLDPQASSSFGKGGLSSETVWRGDATAFRQAHAPAPNFSEPEPDRHDDFKVFSRSLTEISADVAELLNEVDRVLRRMGSDVDDFTKLTRLLQDGITQSRMVPIGNLYTRLARAARDASMASGKQVELTFSGAETELDNNIIQQISDPLMHLVRNAVAHGVERGEERYHAGKSETARIAVRAYPRGNHIFVEVEDDGRGIDFDRVRSAAIDTGLVSDEAANKLSKRELLEFLFYPGFSTAEGKTELAGRGVGLDVVRTNLNALDGEIEIDTQRSLGTRFTLKLPLTLIISQALFVRCGGSTFAFPLTLVEEIRRLKADDLEEIDGKLFARVRDTVTEIARLDSLLQLGPIEPVNGFYRLVMVNVSGRQMGVIVEDVIYQDEIVVKNLGDYLRNLKLFPGATVAPDGTLVLLVDLNRLLVGESVQRRPLMAHVHPNETRFFAPAVAAVAHGAIPAAATDLVPEEKVVVLADDSISVRKIVGRMLEKAGYRVKLASDGLEALEIVRRSTCNLLITDLEMPRTNGFELLALLQEQPEINRLPVVVVTSRAGARYKDHALRQGAAAFLLKPVQEEQLISVVHELTGMREKKRKAAASGIKIAHAATELSKNLLQDSGAQNQATNG